VDIGERIGTSREEGQFWLWSALLLCGWFQSCSFNLKSYPRSKQWKEAVVLCSEWDPGVS
jgi:hypothetical protein